ncbi:acyltransferase family protein [Dyella flagellata]|uniref:Acyltransferase n=1 Tax=Dyella flagellata TaxID=1867833 RepID=A0ABQ5XBQ5_9GAMM|nr:acyltransferase [Dyella flagellata]GLQ88084.1 acyltransferase [Dyella flagellata]
MNTPKLSEVAVGRENNLNMIRLLAASLVLYSHSFPLAGHPAGGVGSGEAIGVLLGTQSGGSIAVDAFFLISGFLVTGSLLKRKDLLFYFRSRALRLFPALFASLVLTVFVLGPCVTSLPTAEYFANSQTYHFFFHNLTLWRADYLLPGVFQDQPNTSPNGSLWTLPMEGRMYLMIATIWVLRGFKTQWLFNLVAISGVIFSISWPQLNPFVLEQQQCAVVASFFLIGMLAYVNREFIPVRGDIAAFLFMLSAVVHGQPSFDVVFGIALAYGVLWLGFIPKIGFFNRIGDYSYGIYVYAFPIQQLYVHLFKDVGPLKLFVFSMPTTLLLAVASWHYLEKPALNLKGRRTDRLARRSLESVS